MRRVGLFGGTFDPVHVGHLVAAEFVREACALEKMVLIPARTPPHKGEAVAPPEDRFRMLELAVAGRPGLAVSRVELEREGPSYTVDTLRRLTSQYPEIRFAWVVGADQLLEFPTWKDPEEIVALADLIAVVRPGYNEQKGVQTVRDRFPGAKIEVAEIPRLDISSSDLRARLAAGRTVSVLVPPPVQEYILRKGLYEKAGRPR
ncbi:MAG: nicotinate-nucleotide adenylyltransferase [Alicyclobacillaceae bacterium]|nr:nicotinate-nucleotide adenylyltransferase [Alicyclobacillaceae bacterium]